MWWEYVVGTDTVGTQYQVIDISVFPATPWLSMGSTNHHFLSVCMSLPYFTISTYTCHALPGFSHYHLVRSLPLCTSINKLANVVPVMPEYSVLNYYYPKKILSATDTLGAHYRNNHPTLPKY